MSTVFILTHVCTAVIALLSGFLAMSLRKGSGGHGAAGTVFFTAMLAMTASAAVIASFYRINMANAVVAFLTFYLVVTAWRAAKHRDGRTGVFDATALLYVTAVGIAGWIGGLQAAGTPRGTKHGMPAAIYFVFGTIALLCAVSDFRMLRRGALSGAERIVRHLWRMSLALLIATLSFYPGQARLFPAWLKETKLLLLPLLFVLGAMLFFRYRYRVRKKGRTTSAPAAGRAEAFATTIAVP